ncbi:DUF3912 family protein [Bacillus sp. NPDC077411]|uniref:DUF3912 family protein n=1 Tax=Bacillus bruguierae TaxID=3127667 RepID=A0ABU8FCA0_9BACI|nr:MULTISPECIES: DUF3912 family protein [unclassified Bacillus (in: firmicutes)]
MNFDITGQKAYVKDGPHRNQIGIIKRDSAENSAKYVIVIDGMDIDIELKDIVLIDVDVRQFHDWCEEQGYL